ncbi:CLIP-associating protein 1-A isoform X5 [Strongylocentrotus purpuratus]|uniref:TOG domain-containing protein n=1 Tax=Strongylocentrotus purpuratus TaxID=7668 RepID=A0A7M7ST12_STRPU|nr:CLIP-associating protein 1-A isoform X5 [Strongylocentrotus purpuratus]
MAGKTLDDIFNDVLKQDTTSKFQASEDLQNYLQDNENSMHCDNMDRLVDALAGWVNSSNFKISLCGLECLLLLVDRIGEKFKNHIGTVLPAALDRLGDSKEQVREHSQALIQKLMSPASAPQFVFERLMKGFSHKGWRVREEVLLCLMQTINVFGANSLLLNKIVPSICKLLGDPNSQVRDTAINTLVEIYRHVGEKVRIDLGKKGIPSSRLSIIYAKFDDVKRSGQMLVQPEQSAPAKPSASQDETDSKPAAAQKTAPAKRPTTSTTQRKSISRPSTGASSGAVDEALFQASYEDVPSVSIFTTKQLEDDLSKMSTILNNDKADWELRVTALKKLRAFIIAGAAEYECFGQSLRQMEEALIMSVKDLRSTVLREACITLAFLSIRLRRQFDHAAEAVLPHLFTHIQNSVKIMATSGIVAIDVIIRHTHSPRLISIMKSNATSKSTAIRKQTFQYINTVLNVWDTHTLERHANLLSEAIHKGIEDADSEARAISRKAFWKFSEHFKSHADKLFNNLDPSKQKMLQGELSQASSCTSLDGRPLSRSATASSHENLRLARDYNTVTASLPRRSVASRSNRASESSDKPALLNQRSSSEINLAAASRARSRYSSAGQRAASGAAARISRSKSTSRESLAATPRGSSLLQTPNGRAGRTRSRIGISQSQPGSRSNSRSSSPSTVSSRYSNIQTNGRTRRKSGIPVPRSQGASREASPSRYGYASARERRQSGSSLGPAQREPKEKQNIMAQRVLVPGQDAEAALADALISAQRALRSNYGFSYDSDYTDNLAQKVMLKKRYDNNFSDDESDASSVCSVGSYGSGPAKIIEDVPEVLNKMASPAWSERKEGLIGLQYTLHSNRALSRSEIKRVTELFSRMFADPSSKTFSLFLETLGEFIIVHKAELLDWLFVLITRLLQKMGSDLLGSVLNKVQRTLEIVRESFPYEIQFRILTKYIMDQTQTPNMKTKVAMLRFMESLTDVMDPADFSNSAETRLAVSRIIGWTKEAKSPEVRRASQAVLIALFELNTPEFSMMLSVLPKTYQEGATKLLRNDLRIASSIDDEITAQEYRSKASPRSVLKASPRSTGSSPRGSYASNGPPDTEFLNSEDIYDSLRRTTAEIQNYMHSSRDDLDHVAVTKDTRVDSDEVLPDLVPGIRVDSPEGKVKEYLEYRMVSDPDSMLSPPPITHSRSFGDYRSVSGARSPTPQKKFHAASSSSQAESRSKGRPRLKIPSADGRGSRTQSPAAQNRARARSSSPSPPALANQCFTDYDSSSPTPPVFSPDALSEPVYNPLPMPTNALYRESASPVSSRKNPPSSRGIADTMGRMTVTDGNYEDETFPEVDHQDILVPLLTELSNHNGRFEERKNAMMQLIRLTRSESLSLWDDHFKTVLLLMLETLGDVESSIRAMALRVLREILRNQPDRFKDYAELTILKILEAHRDPHSEVVRQAEETSATLAISIAPSQCVRVLCPIIQTADCPINQAAIKMLTKVVELMSEADVLEILPEVIVVLLKSYDHTESSVRKASVFCLVAIYNIIGDKLKEKLADLPGSKMKLLNLYIKRAQAEKEAQTPSPSSPSALSTGSR